MDRLKQLAFGFLGALLLLLIYQCYLDHERIRQVCANVTIATQGKFTCW